MSGYITISRKLIDSDWWESEPFTKPQAWIDLIYLARWKDGAVWIAGEEIPVKRGQSSVSMDKMAKRWQWSRNKVSKFLQDLEKKKRITKKTNTRTTIVTICNYDKYQLSPDFFDTQENIREKDEGHQKSTIEKGKIRDKKDNSSGVLFSDDEIPPEEKKYKFEGKIIRLTVKDYDKLQKTFHGIMDFPAHVIALDAELDGSLNTENQRKKWYPAFMAKSKYQHENGLRQEKNYQQAVQRNQNNPPPRRGSPPTRPGINPINGGSQYCTSDPNYKQQMAEMGIEE